MNTQPQNERKQLHWLSYLLTLILLLPSALIAEIPSLLYVPMEDMDPNIPFWVSREAAIGPDGKLATEFFHPIAAELLNSTFSEPARPENDCNLAWEEVYQDWVNPPDRTTLDKLLQESEFVFLATIVDREFGFDRGIPGQLFEVVPKESFVGQLRLSSYYFFLPIGTFDVGPYKICKSDKRFPEYIPNEGEDVLLAIPQYAQPKTDEPFFDLVFDESIITIKPDGKLSLPDIFRRSVNTTLRPFPDTRDAVLRELRAFHAGVNK